MLISSFRSSGNLTPFNKSSIFTIGPIELLPTPTDSEAVELLPTPTDSEAVELLPTDSIAVGKDLPDFSKAANCSALA